MVQCTWKISIRFMKFPWILIPKQTVNSDPWGNDILNNKYNDKKSPYIKEKNWRGWKKSYFSAESGKTQTLFSFHTIDLMHTAILRRVKINKLETHNVNCHSQKLLHEIK